MEQLLEAPAMSSRRIAPPIGKRVGFTNYGAETQHISFGGFFGVALAGSWEFFLNGAYLTPNVDYTYTVDGIVLKQIAMYAGDRIEGVFLGLERPIVGSTTKITRQRLRGRFSPDLSLVYFDQAIPLDANSFDLFVGGMYIPPRQIASIEGKQVRLLEINPSWNAGVYCWANFSQVS